MEGSRYPAGSCGSRDLARVPLGGLLVGEVKAQLKDPCGGAIRR